MSASFRTETNSVSRTIENISSYFKYLSRIGAKGFDCSPQSLAIIEAWGRPRTLEGIRSSIGRCSRCGLAVKEAPVNFGEGPPTARLMFVGDAPIFGQTGDGHPPADPASELLTKIIQAMALARESVYICPIVKCPTPDGRPPLPEEIGACLPILKQQVQVIAPDIICTLGPAAAGALLNTSAPISRLRGKFHDFSGIRVMPTYHPAHLLTNPEKKRAVWEDIKQVMHQLERVDG